METCRSLLISSAGYFTVFVTGCSVTSAMFYTLELTRQLEIPPRYFGPKLLQEIERRLRLEVEGSCSGLHGFVIAVTGVVRGGVQRGVIREGVGSAVFKVTYESFVFMPHKGEVIDAVVKSVNKARQEIVNDRVYNCRCRLRLLLFLCLLLTSVMFCRWDFLLKPVHCKYSYPTISSPMNLSLTQTSTNLRM